jgi:hypothetical protein
MVQRLFGDHCRQVLWEIIMKRRQFLRFAAGAAALPAISPDASAQTYPSHPITMIVPAAAGAQLGD